MKRLNLEVTDLVYQHLKRTSDIEGRTMSKIVDELLAANLPTFEVKRTTPGTTASEVTTYALPSTPINAGAAPMSQPGPVDASGAVVAK